MFLNTAKVDEVRFYLTLVRHAETTANADGIIQGLLDTELSDIGYRQTKVLGQRLQHHRFSHIYSSDLKRAANTARQILLYNRASSCAIKYDKLLRERMFGRAQGRTREWFRALAKKNGTPHTEFTPPGAETTAQVRERAVKFFRTLCQELLIKSCAHSLLTQSDSKRMLSRPISTEDLSLTEYIIRTTEFNRPISLENIHHHTTDLITSGKSRQSSVDSVFDQSGISSNQQSISSSSSSNLSDHDNSERQQSSNNYAKYSQCDNQSTNLDILVVSHGGILRELIKYFVFNLKTDLGIHTKSVHAIAPNTSITRFQVTCSVNEQFISTVALELIDYHNKTHLINANNEKYCLDTENRCSL